MMKREKLPIEAFDYNLPDDCIAYTPARDRAESKLLVWDDSIIAESNYAQIANFIPENSTLLFNNSKVIAARIFFEKNKINNSTSSIDSSSKESQIEIFCLEPSVNYSPVAMAMQASQKVEWICLVGGAKKWKEGSVAAPTAGLHFNEKIFQSLAAKKIDCQFLSLHVGAGTFLPVKTAHIDDHPMHAEFFEVPKSVIEFLLNKAIQIAQQEKSGPVIAVGTTSLRTIESLYWLGVKLIQLKNTQGETKIPVVDVKLLQWDAYELQPFETSNQEALQALLTWMEANQMSTLITSTQLMIVPGYTFKLCNGLITNFHQPKSTLLLIIAAITGEKWKSIYQHAIHQDYRFLSYGDGSLFWIR